MRSRQYKYIWNFTPETRFQNACTQSDIFQSWRERADSDPDAADKVRRYEHRPGEELYDVSRDPYEWNNLADDPQYGEVKARLRRELLSWMQAMGDEGQQTELNAIEHQTRSLKQNKPNGPKPKARKTRKKAQGG